MVETSSVNHKAGILVLQALGRADQALGRAGGTGLSVAFSGWLGAHQAWLWVEYWGTK